MASAIWKRVRAASGSDRDLGGAIGYAVGLAAAAVLVYAFNAFVARRLLPDDFGTFGALLAALLALSGPITALLGGAAMAAARSRVLPRPRWRTHVQVAAGAAALAALLPLPATSRALCWFAAAAAMSVLLAWNRGLLIGAGRLGVVGGSLILEGAARVAFMVVLVTVRAGLPAAVAGLALGIGAAWGATEVLVPRPIGSQRRVGAGVGPAMLGLLFLGAVQFADVIAVRLVHPHGAGSYAAAATVARLALYAQAPAAAYALRRAATAGPARAVRWSIVLALVPGVAVTAVLEAAPRAILSRSFGARYAGAADLVRLLAPAMLLAGGALVLVHLLMGAGRTSWVWSMAAISVAGLAALFLGAAVPKGEPVVMLAVQGALLLAAAVHAAGLLPAAQPARRGVLIFNWRDTRHPQGGGSEVFVEQVARRLVAAGRPVTIFCARHPDGPREEVRDGVRFVRRGTWWSVYLWGALYHLTGRFGPHDVVVDVENGIPFFSPLFCRRPVVVLVHHVHREHWGMVFGPRIARAGWWVESRLVPVLYRRASYVAVSEATKADLVDLGVAADRITVVRNGNLDVDGFVPGARATVPTILFLGRLVPAKRIELLLEAAALLRADHPELTVRIIGRGEWEQVLRRDADRLGLDGSVRFEGFAADEAKLRALSESWVLALPSVKEGWGLAVMEAAAVGTPAVAFRVGGLRESVVEGETGLLVDDLAGFVEALRALLDSAPLRDQMGTAARERARLFSWDDTAVAFDEALRRAEVVAAVEGVVVAPVEA